ncbi:hypothetical protein DFH09DRAFT_1215054, partial [Mycena vulgaris]
MREHLSQMQLDQDASAQPQTPPPCARDDAPIVNSNSNSKQPLAVPALAPAASDRSLRDRQPLPAIGAAFPPIASIARLDSDSAPEGERTLPAVRVLFPAALTCTSTYYPETPAPPTPREPAPTLAALQAQLVILHPSGDPYPTAPALAVGT